VTTLLAFAFVLGVLVFVHELGHFLMARWHGVRVLTFSLGFGPKLLKTRRGDTEYCISAIPLGGYVKMAGENPEDERTGASDEFMSKTKWQRFQIFIMGPLMNLVLAVILLAIVLAQGAQIPAYQDQPPVIGGVEADSPAAKAGLKPGDRILYVNGEEAATWDKLFMLIGTKADRDVALTVVRDGREETVTVQPVGQGRFQIGDIGVMPDVHPRFGAVTAGAPAERAGMQVGDEIVAINGDPVYYPSQVVEKISKSDGAPVQITLRRDGAERTVEVAPEMTDGVPRIGISDITIETRTFKPGPLEAIGLSVQRNVETAGMILVTIKELVVGQTSPKQLMGPVGIAQLSGESAQLGWIALFTLMATISLNLGLINLLPIPVLDGGHIFIMMLEAIARRDFSIQVKEKMLLGGFVLLMMLMVTVIYNDLTRIAWIERLMPWRN
jgi:regulator of sigma E protease